MLKILYITVLWASVVSLSLGQAISAPQAQTTSAPGSRVSATSEEVLMDVVVRDKKGRAVKDLKPDDFRVFDNGQAKTIKSFRLIEGNDAVASGGARTPLEPPQRVRSVMMIFQCHHDDARRLARDGALDLLKQELASNVDMAVMTIDQKLEVLQPYTNDPAALREAIARATSSRVFDFSANTARVRRELQQAIGSSPQSAPSQATESDAQAKAVMNQMLLEALNTEHSNAVVVAGRDEIFSLLDAVKEQYRLPGRKTIVYFSEGFTIPIGLEAAFDDLIGTANRSNVSLYVVDAWGLLGANPNQSGRNELRAAAQSSQSQHGNMGDRPVTMGEANLIDTAIRSTRANYQMTLARLADSTGGFLITNTNDLRAPIRRLAEDVQSYYEISYAPEIKKYDGSFHKVVLKVASGDLRVQSRSGYNAFPTSLNSSGAAPVPYEIPLLAALNSPELSKAFEYGAAGLYFRGLRNQSECEVVMDVPLSNVTFKKAEAGDQYKGSLSYLVVVKDVQRQVVKKLENEVPINATSERLETLKANHFIYTETFDLPPGRYSLETAVRDGEGDRISAGKGNVIMAPSSGLAISGVSVVRSTKERGASTADDDPFLLGTKVISPTLNPVISKANNSTLPFYLVIYTDKNVAAAPQLIMEFSRNGKVLGKGLPPLGSPDKDGKIQYVAMTPLDRFEPGDFTVRFIVKQGSETAEASASFALK